MKKNVSNESLSEVAVKGSIYDNLSLFGLKIGGLVFTIIIARILLPELFGVYSLVLSIVTIVLTFTDLGINTTSTRYISDSLGKNDARKAKGYILFFTKGKILLTTLSIILLLGISKFLSFSLYKNPLIYYPLLFSCLLIISESFREFLGPFFVAKKDLKPVVYITYLSQILKIGFAILAIILFSSDFKVTGLFIALFLSSAITLIFSYFFIKSKYKELFVGKPKLIKKSNVNSYWKYMAIATLSLAFFGSIDTLMLGGFVSTEYLAYYRVALSLILTIASVFSLSNIFLPIFTQIHKRRFERGFQKTMRYLLLFSIPAAVGFVFIAKYVVFLIYGTDYLPAVSSIYYLSLLIITTPLIGLCSTVLESKEKPKIVGNAVLISLVANVMLNYLAIKVFISDPLMVIAGVGAATTISRLILLGILVFYSRKELKLKVRGLGLKKPILATIVMGMFLYLFNLYFDINIFTGIIEVIIGAAIYFVVLISLGGLVGEDLKLIKGLFKKIN